MQILMYLLQYAHWEECVRFSDMQVGECTLIVGVICHIHSIHTPRLGMNTITERHLLMQRVKD